MSGFSCEQCAAPMAAAETLCSRCGTPAPAGRAAQLLMAKADAAWDAGDFLPAILQLERALQSGLPHESLALAWRKLGVWLESRAAAESKPELLARAGQAFKTALSLDDSNEVLHQLFIANWGKQGLFSKARDYYQARLSADPGDAMAQKQLNVIRLSADFLAMAPPAPPKEARSTLERWLEPRPWKVGLAGLTCLGSLAMAVVSKFHEAGPLVKLDPSDLGPGGLPINIDALMFDQGLWYFQAALSALAIFFMYRSKS